MPDDQGTVSGMLQYGSKVSTVSMPSATVMLEGDRPFLTAEAGKQQRT